MATTKSTKPKRPRTPAEAPEAVKRAGYHLKTLREAHEWTQAEVAKRSGLTNQQVNRLELGRVDKPPMRDLVLIGHVFGLNPNEVATLYGYWNGEDSRTAEDEALVIRARHLLKEGVLTPKARALLLRWIAFGINEATMEMAP